MTTDDKFDPSHQFFVGQEVVCIKADLRAPQRMEAASTSGLEVDRVYRIRWLGIYNHYLDGEYLGIKVDGIVRPMCPVWGYVDPPFYSDRFRPVVPDPLAALRNLSADPNGYVPAAPEGPIRDKPVREGVPEREREEVE